MDTLETPCPPTPAQMAVLQLVERNRACAAQYMARLSEVPDGAHRQRLAHAALVHYYQVALGEAWLESPQHGFLPGDVPAGLGTREHVAATFSPHAPMVVPDIVVVDLYRRDGWASRRSAQIARA